jgi:hypothetical protein
MLIIDWYSNDMFIERKLYIDSLLAFIMNIHGLLGLQLCNMNIHATHIAGGDSLYKKQ